MPAPGHVTELGDVDRFVGTSTVDAWASSGDAAGTILVGSSRVVHVAAHPSDVRRRESAHERERTVPVFMVERQFAEQLEATPETAADINRINDDAGVRWLSSFLSADKRKTFCLYEADDVDAIRRAAVRAGLPADAIVELSGTIAPDGSFAAMG